ncbi:MAG TPA: substrate-binding domain-containing protein [Thermoplasmata archaeon]|nr:substrate-binding domain-containing protein [Thermoplasmata archaeon]
MRKLVLRRQAHLRRSGKAVSPVVATLILILIAVAAAAALYLWLVAFQGGVTKGIGSGGSTQYTVSIGGSTSVFPFTEVAIAQFEQNNSNIAVTDNQGGTGAGMLAVCHGAVDIGASSSLQTPTGLETNDGCPSTVTVTTVAYDAVDVIVPSANTHGLLSMSYDTLTAIYDGTSGGAATLLAPSIDGAAVTAVPYAIAPWSTHAALTWSDIPAAVAGGTVAGCTVTTETVSTVAATPGANTGVPCAAPNTNDFYTAAGTSSSCGWTICAGGNVAIVTVARSDASGTTQTFEARLLGATSATAFASSVSGLGFSGCGSNNLIADCGMSSTKTGNGNPGVISTVAGNPDAIGYASDGLARASGSGVAFAGFLGPAQPLCSAASGCSAGGVVPTTGATGTISAGIKSSATTPNYVGWRPFEYVTTNTPTGEVQRFLEFVLFPANNLNLASEASEVSVYSI